jgi:hypothetical protein
MSEDQSILPRLSKYKTSDGRSWSKVTVREARAMIVLGEKAKALKTAREEFEAARAELERVRDLDRREGST